MHLYVHEHTFYKCICRVWVHAQLPKEHNLDRQELPPHTRIPFDCLSRAPGISSQPSWSLPEIAPLFRRPWGNQLDISYCTLAHPSILCGKQDSFNSRRIQAWLSSELRQHQQEKLSPPLGSAFSTWSSSSSSRWSLAAPGRKAGRAGGKAGWTGNSSHSPCFAAFGFQVL